MSGPTGPMGLFNRAMERLGEHTAEMPALLDEVEREARAQGQLLVQASVEMGRAEMGLLTGDWDAAVRAGRRALDLAMAEAFDGVALRTGSALASIAAYRGDASTLRELDAWLRRVKDAGETPNKRLMHAAQDHLIAAGTDADPRTPDPDRLRDAWALPYGDPTFVAARDAVLRAWWDDGRFDDLTDALVAMPDPAVGGPLGAGARFLWLARMGSDEESIVGTAREALTLLRRWDAAWWIEQAMGILDDVGDATRDEREERRLIRLRLLGDPVA